MQADAGQFQTAAITDKTVKPAKQFISFGVLKQKSFDDCVRLRYHFMEFQAYRTCDDGSPLAAGDDLNIKVQTRYFHHLVFSVLCAAKGG